MEPFVFLVTGTKTAVPLQMSFGGILYCVSFGGIQLVRHYAVLWTPFFLLEAAWVYRGRSALQSAETKVLETLCLEQPKEMFNINKLCKNDGTLDTFFFAGGCLGWSRAERPSVS